ncbi:hypothetical protein CR513_28720, partial [Mucuna pruriens]
MWSQIMTLVVFNLSMGESRTCIAKDIAEAGSKVIEGAGAGAGANSTFDCKSSTATAFRTRKLLTNGNSPSSNLRARPLLLRPETLNG